MFYYGNGRFHGDRVGSVSIMPGCDNFTALPPPQLPLHHHYAQQFPVRNVNWQDVTSFISACAVKEATGHHSAMPITRRQPGNDVIWRTETGPTYSCCCVPTGCARYVEDRINPNDPGDSVKVICTNPGCAVGRWMHADCFDEWQRKAAYNMRCYQQEAGHLQQTPSARLVLAGQLRMCICGKGFLTKDPNYVSPFSDTSKYLIQSGLQAPRRKDVEQRATGMGLHQHLQQLLQQEDHQQHRMRSCSFSSTGSGSCSSASSSSVNGGASSCGYSSTSASPPLSPPRSFFPPSNSSVSPPPGASNNAASMSSSRGVVSGSGLSQKNEDSDQQSLFRRPPPSTTSSSIPLKVNAPASHHNHHHHHHNHHHHHHHDSVADDSLSTTLTSGDSQPEVDDVSSTPQPNARGNIFRHRPDLSVYRSVQPSARNAYCIQLDDDGPHGNNDTRKFLMHKLTSRGIAAFQCVGCRRSLPVYDEFPVIDGALFLSPRGYDVGSDGKPRSRLSVQVVYNRRMLNLQAVCLDCLGQTVVSDTPRRSRPPPSVRCKSCHQPWTLGSSLILGTMYTYDVFACAPCCADRRSCRRCGQQPSVDDPKSFSDYSKLSSCRHCGLEDYHFVRTFDEVFYCVESSSAVNAKNADVISKRPS